MAQLVLLLQPAQPQRMLVQRREHDAFADAALHGFDREVQRRERSTPRFVRAFTEWRRRAAEPVLREQRDAAGLEAHAVQIVHGQSVKLGAGNRFARGQHHGVGDQQQVGRLQIAPACKQFDGHLGADTGRVAEQHGEPWALFVGHGVFLVGFR